MKIFQIKKKIFLSYASYLNAARCYIITFVF